MCILWMPQVDKWPTCDGTVTVELTQVVFAQFAAAASQKCEKKCDKNEELDKTK